MTRRDRQCHLKKPALIVGKSLNRKPVYENTVQKNVILNLKRFTENRLKSVYFVKTHLSLMVVIDSVNIAVMNVALKTEIDQIGINMI